MTPLSATPVWPLAELRFRPDAIKCKTEPRCSAKDQEEGAEVIETLLR